MNRIPAIRITSNDFPRFIRLILNPGGLVSRIFHNWFKESLITFTSVVATKIRKRNPITASYQFLNRCCRTLNRVVCNSPAVINNCLDIYRGLSTSPKTWIRIIRTAGKAKVVKKAVAPAILNGSFFLNSPKALLNRGKIIAFLKAVMEHWNLILSPKQTRVGTLRYGSIFRFTGPFNFLRKGGDYSATDISGAAGTGPRSEQFLQFCLKFFLSSGDIVFHFSRNPCIPRSRPAHPGLPGKPPNKILDNANMPRACQKLIIDT